MTRLCVCHYNLKKHEHGVAVHLPKRFQWVNISVQIVNDSLHAQTV